MINPHPNPFGKHCGITHEILATLTPEELGQTVAHYTWSQSNERSATSGGKGYNSSAYYAYRTNRWIYEALRLLEGYGYTVNRCTGAVAIKRKVRWR